MYTFVATYVGCLLALLTYAQASTLWTSRRVVGRGLIPNNEPPDEPRSKKRAQLILKIRSLRHVHAVPPARMLLAALDLKCGAVELGDPRDIQAQRAVVAAAYAWRERIDDDAALALRASMQGHAP